MKYELALKLKKAGFHQNGNKPRVCTCGNYLYETTAMGIMQHGSEVVACPTLEELIEACGETKQYYLDDPFDFTLQFISEKVWAAGYSDSSYHEIFEGVEYGETAIEAVANLWLKLNNKS